MKFDDAMNVILTKWPIVVCRGKTVAVEQAKDIILRTDLFLNSPNGCGGNDHDWQEIYRHKAFGDLKDRPDDRDAYVARREKIERLTASSNALYPSYIANVWASSAYMFGPCGWIQPDGIVANSMCLLSKDPSPGWIWKDLKMIAEAFPYLELVFSLYDWQESGENEDDDKLKHYVSFSVKGGKVRVVSQKTAEKLQQLYEAAGAIPIEGENLLKIPWSQEFKHEHGLPQEWVYERADYWRGRIEQIKI